MEINLLLDCFAKFPTRKEIVYDFNKPRKNKLVNYFYFLI